MTTRATRSRSRAGAAACSTLGRAAATGTPAGTPNPAAPAAGLSANNRPKRSAADATGPQSAAGGGGGGGGGASAAKRRRTAAGSNPAPGPAADAAVLTQRIAQLEATVVSQGRRIAKLEAENATLRKPPRLPEPAAALKQLVSVLGAHEPNLRDMLFGLVCMPHYLAKSAGELPANPAGVLGTFAVTVPTGTTAIAWDAFTKCEGLAQVTLPVSVTAVDAGDRIFDDDVDDGDVEGEERGAFSSCLSLREVTLPRHLTEIGRAAFASCSALVEIALPPNLTEIGASAFRDCTSLSEIVLPSKLTTIGASAFEECTTLIRIVLPAGPVDIGTTAFYNCPGTPRRLGN